MSLLEVLIDVAATTFVVGWLVVILDAVTGFKLIERIPSRIVDGFGAIHNGVFVVIAVILSASLIWRLATD
jgi:cellobiose-specific phosphotransferase system component IIC